MNFAHLTAALWLSAEASSPQAASPPPASARSESAPQQPSTPQSTVQTAKLSADEAAGIVEAFRLQQEQKSKGEKSAQIKTVDDVVAVLKRDELAQFDDAAEFAKSQTTPDAKALRAQIELAWGDAQTLLADLLERTQHELSTSRDQIEQKKTQGPLSAGDQTRSDELKASIDELQKVVPALRALAKGHLEEGGKVAEEVMKTTPKSYLGYRVAADYFRLKGDWKKFDEMKKKIESTNPKSNGLVFLRGIEQLERHKKPDEAKKLFREALKNDPKFTRAQAMLVVMPNEIEETYKEYKALEELSPFHQVVVWVGPRIEAARNAALFAKKR